MMDETEIKYEFPTYENQCSVCLSIGRKLSLLGEYVTVFKRITSDVPNHVSVINTILFELIKCNNALVVLCRIF